MFNCITKSIGMIGKRLEHFDSNSLLFAILLTYNKLCYRYLDIFHSCIYMFNVYLFNLNISLITGHHSTIISKLTIQHKLL